MSLCATFTMPGGRVAVVRPNAQLVTILQHPVLNEALAAASRLGVRAARFMEWRGAMLVLTEEEAVRVLAEYTAPRVAIAHGVQAADVTGLSLHDATGLLDEQDKTTRRWRECWRKAGRGAPTVNMSLARIQRMNEVRAQRAPQLEKSDIDLLHAQEALDVVKQDALKTYRQALRDVPTIGQPTVDAITTPEGLAAWEPEWPVDPA